MMSVACRVSIAASLAASTILTAMPAHADTSAPKIQYVLISFDGAHDVEQWQRSRALAARTAAKFTYFLSCVYLLTPDTKSAYKAPGHAAGKSNVGFAASKDDVAARLGEMWTARAEGHEIASHACGHFDGAAWSEKQWAAEFAQFHEIVRDAWTLNGIDGEPAGWKAFVDSEIHGFRAPYLATGKALYEALGTAGFRYDASGVSRGPVEPEHDEELVHFSLPQIPEGPSERRVIAMDYNLFVRHSGGIEAPDVDQAFENRAYEAFVAAFAAQYHGKRAPLQIGFHFSLMNGGAYWRALERFAETTCVKPGVLCVSYADYLKRTESGDAGG